MSDPIPQFASTESLKEHIRETISSVSRIDIAELNDSVLIREEMGVDSLMAMEIVAKCEKQLGIQIDEAELYKVQSLGDFLDLLAILYEEQRSQTA